MFMRLIIITLMLGLNFSPVSAQTTSEEAVYRAAGCRFISMNDNGSKHFECCGTSPGVEVLRLHVESWDIPGEEPTCADSIEYCLTPADCEVHGHYWYADTCNPEPESGPIVMPIIILAADYTYMAGWQEIIFTPLIFCQGDINDGWMTTKNAGVNFGIDTTDAPLMTYELTVDQPGIYYLWIRGQGPDASSDSVNYGIDGTRIGSLTFYEQPWSNDRQYTTSRAELDLTMGPHVLNIWQREDGTAISEIRITNDSEYWPSKITITPEELGRIKDDVKDETTFRMNVMVGMKMQSKEIAALKEEIEKLPCAG